MQQLTFAASAAGLFMAIIFLAAASYFDGSPFGEPMFENYGPNNNLVSLREIRSLPPRPIACNRPPAFPDKTYSVGHNVCAKPGSR